MGKPTGQSALQFMLSLCLMLIAAGATAQIPRVLTTDQSGSINNAGGTLMSISGNGRFALFHALDPLVPEDTTGGQIYVLDLHTDELELISVTPDGTVSAQQQSEPVVDSNQRLISDDGRYALFLSNAPDILPGSNAGPLHQLFLRDRQTQTTTLVSVNNDDEPADASVVRHTMDPSGLAVAFYSANATNLDPLVQPGQGGGVYLHRTDAPVGSSVRTQAACRDRNGVPQGGSCNGWSIACGGGSMAFQGGGFADWIEGEDLAFGESYNDIFVGNPIDGNWIRIGAEADTPIPPDSGGLRSHGSPAISCTGDRVAFHTTYPLVTGDTEDADLYVYNPISQQMFLIESTFGESVYEIGAAVSVSLSPDGSLLAFITDRAIAAGDTNGLEDAYALFLPRDPFPPYTIDWVSEADGVAPDAPVSQVFGVSTSVIGFRTLADNAPWPMPNFGTRGHLFATDIPSEILFGSGFEP